MGADMLLVYTKIERTEEEARAALYAMDDTELLAIAEELEDEVDLDDEEGNPVSSEDKVARIKQKLLTALGIIFPLPGNDRRDIIRLRFKEGDYLLTGGLSWGDAPTEAYDLVSLIDYSEILRTPESLRILPLETRWELLRRYNLVSAYLGNQTDEQWELLKAELRMEDRHDHAD